MFKARHDRRAVEVGACTSSRTGHQAPSSAFATRNADT